MVSDSYQKQRNRWLEIQQTLPDNLRDRIALRNVMAAARLTPAQQQVIADALDIGLKRVPTALRYLKTHPDASAQELFRVSLGTVSSRAKEPGSQEAGEPGSSTPTPPHTPMNPEALEELLDLLKICYPDMNSYSARALAESEALSDILSVLTVYRQVFNSPHFNTDFVVVLFYKLLEQTQERLNQRIANNSAYQQAVHQTGINIPAGQEPANLQDKSTRTKYTEQ